MADLYPVYSDIDGVRKKCTAYMDIDGVRTKISSAESGGVAPENCLTFSSAEPFTIETGNTTKNWDGTLEYSTDGTTWSEWDGTAAIASAEHDGKQRIYMRGSGNSVITGSENVSGDVFPGFRLIDETNSDIECSGNIENLLDHETVAKGLHPSMGAYCFAYLFYKGWRYLITPPELPATTLSSYCYSYMFMNCVRLAYAPKLPALSLSSYCYRGMFRNCQSITTPPEIYATTLAYRCCMWMFYGCINLATSPELHATTLDEECYAQMFQNCTKLTTPPKLNATTLAQSCYYYMFQNCTELSALPELPATILPDICYRGMFYGCSSIKMSSTQTGECPTGYRIPSIETGSQGTNSLYDMFTGTGGTFTGTPSINTTYYTANTVV